MRGDSPGGPIRWRLHLPVAPEQVYDALNTDAGRAAFWAESAEEVAGYIQFRFINGMSNDSRILERESAALWSINYFGSVATFELAADGSHGTDLLLTNEGVSEDDWQEVHAGWLNVLFPLKAYVVHGVDLRNHRKDRLWDDGYADQ